MRLKEGIVAQNIDGVQFLVPVGEGMFRGIIRNNGTAAFIVNCLQQDTTKEQIVDAMCKEYDAPAETIAKDVESVLAKLRSVNALEE